MDISSIRRQVIAFPASVHDILNREELMQRAYANSNVSEGTRHVLEAALLLLEEHAIALTDTLNNAIIEDAAGDATRHELLEAWREIIDLRMRLLHKSL